MGTVVEVPVRGFDRYSIRTDGKVRMIYGRLSEGFAMGRPDPRGKYHRQIRLYGEHGIKVHYLHRMVAEAFVHNPRPDIFDTVDHINRDPTDNRACNLRWLTHQLNTLNHEGRNCSYHKRDKKWVAYLTLGGVHKFLGYYATEEEASAVGVRARGEAFERILSHHLANATHE